MSLKSTAITILLLIVFFASPAQIVISDQLKANIKQRVDSKSSMGIVVGVVDEGGVRYFSYGVKSLKSSDPVDEHSVFEIGSISKTFTGILLADKVLKEEMKLDDPLQKYLPQDVTAPTRNGGVITLVNMSNHTSSLPRMPNNFAPANLNNPFADYNERLMYDFLTHYSLPRDIGSQYEYSNYAAGLLGHQIARNSGITYEELLVNIIAKPLGMEDTRIALTPNMKKNLAMGHSAGTEVENWDLSTLAGAGGIRSTAEDMMKYLSANMGITQSKLYPAMQLSHKVTTPENIAPKVGLGWHIMPAGSKEIIAHNGGTGGYRTYVGFIKGEKKGVVVLSNSNVSIDDIAMHLLNPETPLKTLDKEVTVTASDLEKYVGKYELAQGFILTITRTEDQLQAQATGQPMFPIFAKGNHTFFLKVVEAQLTFNLNNQSVVESVTLNQGGQTIVGKKLE